MNNIPKHHQAALKGAGELIEEVVSRTPRASIAETGAAQSGVHAAALAAALQDHRAMQADYRQRVRDSHRDGRKAMGLIDDDTPDEPAGDDMGDINIGDQIVVNMPSGGSSDACEQPAANPPREPTPQPQAPNPPPAKANGWARKAAAGAAIGLLGAALGGGAAYMMQPKRPNLDGLKFRVVEETDLSGGVKIDVGSE